MARKLNMMTFLQQVQHLEKVNWRCARPQPARELVLPAPSSPVAARRKLTISIAVQKPPDTLVLVSIIQVKDNAAAPR